MTPTVNQTVNYVAAPEKEGESPRIKKAVIVSVDHHDSKTGKSIVRLDHSARTKEDPAGSHIALAEFDDEDKKPNTWHYPEAAQNGAAPVKPATQQKGPSAS